MTVDVPDIHRLRTFFVHHSPAHINAPDLRRAAVLFAFHERHDGLHILLTKRTDEVEHHKGQVSFPGGVCDPGDIDVRDTALREAMEEIGLRRESVEVLGETDEYETPSGFIITPVVGILRHVDEYTLNRAEVEDVFFAPVALFATPGNEEMSQREWKGALRDVYAYQFGPHRIWGVTAGIIRNLLRNIGERTR